MLDWLFAKVEENKDATLLLPLRFLNRISAFFEKIYDVFLGWFVPILYESHIKLKWKVIIIILLFIGIAWFYISSKYRNKDIEKLKNDKDILNNYKELIDSLNLLSNSMNYALHQKSKEIFKDISDDVVNMVYTYLKKTYNMNTRVSVLQQYKNSKGKKMCKIISRRSKKSMKSNGKTYIVNKKTKYHFIKILLKNEEKNQYLSAVEVTKNIDSKLKEEFKEYIAIPVKDGNKDIEFILQIDILDNEYFKSDQYKINDFIQTIIDPFINVLKLAYSTEYELKGGDVL